MRTSLITMSNVGGSSVLERWIAGGQARGRSRWVLIIEPLWKDVNASNLCYSKMTIILTVVSLLKERFSVST